jgi:hypothetical protein
MDTSGRLPRGQSLAGETIAQNAAQLLDSTEWFLESVRATGIEYNSTYDLHSS